jgi:diaminohydroxyphosphoribosylaminopyrimidine deaminase/5-amino-6-(5-phosphoribosylamino)uracil reductase
VAALGVLSIRPVALLGGLGGLGGRGLTRVLVVGGRTLATALLAAGLADRLCWFRAAALIGDDGLPALGPLGVARMADLRRLTRLSVEPAGEDLLETYALRP